ncbi:MAG: acylneuraminate cytidylyltransferase family protein [Lachnospiraceae bacterium]|nr:acylneuraminate cytidylyltransferase family protein [Lachnospiraceae bacterium]
MKVLFVITARGGSKGIPGKNIKTVGGIPLIAYKIISAKRCRYNCRIIVSTDDENIASVARKYGAEVPFMRPKELAADTSDSMDVVMHALNWVIDSDPETYDYICLLEPSSPFATPNDLNKALDCIVNTRADTLLGMKEVEVSKDFIFELDEKGGLSLFYESIKKMSTVRRQDQKPQYTMNGCMYIARVDYFIEQRSFHSVNSKPYIMPWERSIEIDTEQDLKYAEYLVETGAIDLEEWGLSIGVNS